MAATAGDAQIRPRSAYEGSRPSWRNATVSMAVVEGMLRSRAATSSGLLVCLGHQAACRPRTRRRASQQLSWPHFVEQLTVHLRKATLTSLNKH
jgi:hypothetical protein